MYKRNSNQKWKDTTYFISIFFGKTRGNSFPRLLSILPLRKEGKSAFAYTLLRGVVVFCRVFDRFVPVEAASAGLFPERHSLLVFLINLIRTLVGFDHSSRTALGVFNSSDWFFPAISHNCLYCRTPENLFPVDHPTFYNVLQSGFFWRTLTLPQLCLVGRQPVFDYSYW